MCILSSLPKYYVDITYENDTNQLHFWIIILACPLVDYILNDYTTQA